MLSLQKQAIIICHKQLNRGLNGVFTLWGFVLQVLHPKSCLFIFQLVSSNLESNVPQQNCSNIWRRKHITRQNQCPRGLGALSAFIIIYLEKEEEIYLKMGPVPHSQTVTVRHHAVTKTTKGNGTRIELFLMIQQGTCRFVFFVIKIFNRSDFKWYLSSLPLDWSRNIEICKYRAVNSHSHGIETIVNIYNSSSDCRGQWRCKESSRIPHFLCSIFFSGLVVIKVI